MYPTTFHSGSPRLLPWAGLNTWLDSTLNPSGLAGWSPAVDVRELANEFVITAELAGLTRDDVEISVEDGVLTLSGDKKVSTEKEEGETYVVERRYGRFERHFKLPRSVESKAVEASFTDGVLTIRLPKAAEAKSRRIAIK